MRDLMQCTGSTCRETWPTPQAGPYSKIHISRCPKCGSEAKVIGKCG